MILSVHPRKYCVEEARNNPRYAALFTRGWESADVKRSEEFCWIVTNRVWSPCLFKDGHRLRDNFVAARLLALDFDNPGYSLAQAMREWCDTTHWIGVTKNHQRDKGGIVCDRFRLIVPYTEQITDADQYNFNYAEIAKEYDSADQGTKDAARLFFPCREIVSTCTDGYLQPVKPLPPIYYEKQRTRQSWEQASIEHGIIPDRLRAAFELPIKLGKQSNTIYGVSKELARYGFSFGQLREMFLTSATFRDVAMSPAAIKKIERTIENGIKANR